MNDAKKKKRSVFLEIHTDLPREGPGSQISTEKAFSLLTLPDAPSILDVACGPGMQTLDLARLAPEAAITAVDILPGNISEVQKRVDDAGIAGRVTVRQADMRHLDYPDASFDVVWCEGAAYIMGVENALRDWSRMLKPGGFLAFTDNVWIAPSVPKTISEWWKRNYPEMRVLSDCSDLWKPLGYDEVGSFVLPSSDWWDDYYNPLKKRLKRLRVNYAEDSIALAILSETQKEIDLYREYGDYYSYAFFVLQKPSD